MKLLFCFARRIGMPTITLCLCSMREREGLETYFGDAITKDAVAISISTSATCIV